jgi:copper chaperone CopZ
LALTGRTTIPDRIKEKIQQGFCRCETMNPQGSCCLGNVNKAVREVRSKLAMQGTAATESEHGNADGKGVGTASGTARSGPIGEKGPWLATLGAVFTAVVGSACCWLPLLLIAFGFSAAGVGSFFEQYRSFFLTVTFALLSVAWYLTYRKIVLRAWRRLTGNPALMPAGKACCASETQLGAAHSCCATEPEPAPANCCAARSKAVGGKPSRGFTVRHFNQLMPWIATVFILLFALFPHWVALVFGRSPSAPAVKPNGQQVVLDVQGMTCEGCTLTARQAVSRVPGVAHVEVNYNRAEAVVTFQPGSTVQPEALIRAFADVGYSAKLKQ